MTFLIPLLVLAGIASVVLVAAGREALLAPRPIRTADDLIALLMAGWVAIRELNRTAGRRRPDALV